MQLILVSILSYIIYRARRLLGKARTIFRILKQNLNTRNLTIKFRLALYLNYYNFFFVCGIYICYDSFMGIFFSILKISYVFRSSTIKIQNQPLNTNSDPSGFV